MILDREKIEKALEDISIKINKKHVYDAIVNTHTFRFCEYDNLNAENSVLVKLEQTLKIGNYMVFVHSCSNAAMGFFFALKIIEFGH